MEFEWRFSVLGRTKLPLPALKKSSLLVEQRAQRAAALGKAPSDPDLDVEPDDIPF
jgi:hypothetical protein